MMGPASGTIGLVASALLTFAVLTAWTNHHGKLESRNSQASALIEKQTEKLASLETRRWSHIDSAGGIEEACTGRSYKKQIEEASTLLQTHQKYHDETLASIQQHWRLGIFLFLVSFWVNSIFLLAFLSFCARGVMPANNNKGLLDEDCKEVTDSTKMEDLSSKQSPQSPPRRGRSSSPTPAMARDGHSSSPTPACSETGSNPEMS